MSRFGFKSQAVTYFELIENEFLTFKKEAKMKEKNQRQPRVLTAKQFIKKIKIVMEPIRRSNSINHRFLQVKF